MTLTKITAPYGFVPLSEQVVEPEWLALVPTENGKVAPPIHDVPFVDGICGSLELEVEAETPIFTRGAGGKPGESFKIGERYAVPGTALRGSLRNIVEIVTFGRFQRVNDHRYAVRDLHNRDLYGQYMAEIVKDPRTGRGEPMPLVNAGWLSRKEDGDGKIICSIEVCDFAKIEYRELQKLARGRDVQGFDPGRKQTSAEKYHTWRSASLDVTVAFSERRPPEVGRRRMLSRYGLAVPATEGVEGHLVFTGQPTRWTADAPRRPGSGHPKHHDFVFMAQQKAQQLKVDPELFEDFEFAHSDRGQQNNLGRSRTPNPEWKHWQSRFEKGERVPVFFIMDGDKIRSFGLAMMFRLASRHSIHEAIDHVHPNHLKYDSPLDFAEGLFGTVRTRRRGAGRESRDRDEVTTPAIALKGRVGISHALAIEPVQELPLVEVVLGAPRASYYPNYVEQDPRHPGSPPPLDSQGKPRYRTWMDREGRPRGWKRYRALQTTWKPEPPSGGDGRSLDQEKMKSNFRPLAAGTRFRAHVSLHNLRPEEVGCLLWVLDFGGDGDARHMLGMGRPLGYGRCRLSLHPPGLALQDVHGKKVDREECRRRFESYMEKKIPGWKESPQLRELRTLARPVPTAEARYQRLDPGRRVDEFVEARKNGLALPSAAGMGRRSPPAAAATSSPRGPRQHPGGYHASPSRTTTAASPLAPAKKTWAVNDVIEVTLTTMSSKGKWNCTVVGDEDARGTIQGEPPPDTVASQVHKVIVQNGSNRSGLVLKWGAS